MDVTSWWICGCCDRSFHSTSASAPAHCRRCERAGYAHHVLPVDGRCPACGHRIGRDCYAEKELSDEERARITAEVKAERDRANVARMGGHVEDRALAEAATLSFYERTFAEAKQHRISDCSTSPEAHANARRLVADLARYLLDELGGDVPTVDERQAWLFGGR